MLFYFSNLFAFKSLFTITKENYHILLWRKCLSKLELKKPKLLIICFRLSRCNIPFSQYGCNICLHLSRKGLLDNQGSYFLARLRIFGVFSYVLVYLCKWVFFLSKEWKWNKHLGKACKPSFCRFIWKNGKHSRWASTLGFAQINLNMADQ